MQHAVRARRVPVEMLVVFVLGTAGVHAQNAGPFDDWKDTAPPKTPALDCRDLRAETGYDFSVDAATAVTDRQGVPEFCQVQGLVLPEVRFEVALPRAWNGRLYMFGNGGYAGESLSAQARLQRRDLALRNGFAVAQTNTGHELAREPLGSFAVNPQKLADYAYRAVHVTALTAKKLAGAYYGTVPDRSYFDGCSTGGRQGLISAQRFPQDFDGIVVGAPVLDFSGTMLHYRQFNKALRAAPGLAKKTAALAAAISAKCDSSDGLEDGLIGDPRACRFDPAADLPKCTDGQADGCFASEDVAALQAVYGDVKIRGATRFRGLPLGTEAIVQTPKGPRSGWDGWIVSPDGQPTIGFRFLETFFKYMVTPGREIDWAAFDPETESDKLQTIGTMLNATDPDLTRFKARGGKILMYYGWADPALNPLMGVGYYEQVREKMGASTSDFFRLFMMPGVFHCGGGPGPDQADMITRLIRWVEQGAAPESIVVSKTEAGKVLRTRPLCPYPQVAEYSGKGSIDDAANFACRSN